METFLRLHQISIWNLKFRRSKRFRFKNKKNGNRITDELILNIDPYVFIRWNDERNREYLRIKLSYTIILFTNSVLFLIFGLLSFHLDELQYIFLFVSILFFISGIILKNHCRKFAYNIDFTKEMLTYEVIELTKMSILEKCQK